MKTIILISIITILLILSGFMSYYILNTQASKIVNELNNLEIKIQSEDWDIASKQLENIELDWSKINKKWSMIIDHIEIDFINEDLAELRSYIKTKEQHDALAKINTLRLLIGHIPEKETFSLKNIF